MNIVRLLILVFSTFPLNVWAGWPCSIDHGYPEVSRIEMSGDNVVIELGRYFEEQRRHREDKIQLVYSDEGKWSRADTPVKDLREREQISCPKMSTVPTAAELANMPLYEAPPNSNFRQDLVGCVEYKGEFWSGTSWYGGEGFSGVGGLVSYDTKTDSNRTHYLWGLQKYSVSHLELFDDQLWIGTTYRGECGGPAPGHGLKRYPLVDEKAHPILTWYGRGLSALDVPEVCGFAVRDMLVIEDKLWVATELGLSVADRKEGEKLIWKNYLPDLDSKELMREVSCFDLYSELLRSPRSVTDEGFDIGVMFDQFWNRLSEHREGFVKQYLRKLHRHEYIETVE